MAVLRESIPPPRLTIPCSHWLISSMLVAMPLKWSYWQTDRQADRHTNRLIEATKWVKAVGTAMIWTRYGNRMILVRELSETTKLSYKWRWNSQHSCIEPRCRSGLMLRASIHKAARARPDNNFGCGLIVVGPAIFWTTFVFDFHHPGLFSPYCMPVHKFAKTTFEHWPRCGGFGPC